jgi:hypothetical protein
MVSFEQLNAVGVSTWKQWVFACTHVCVSVLCTHVSECDNDVYVRVRERVWVRERGKNEWDVSECVCESGM